MSDELQRLHRLLDRATADKDVPADELDAETASLREAWTALGDLLEAVQPEAPTFLTRPGMPRHTLRRRLAAAAAVLAASLVIGAVGLWLLHGSGATRPEGAAVAHKQQPASPKQFSQGPAIVKNVAPPKKIEPTPAATVAKSDGVQWNDGLDDQLAQVGREVISVEKNWSAAGSSDTVRYGLEQVQQEIEGNKL